MEKLVYVDRRNTNCNKWDGQQKMFGEEGLHAMWVADMDFRVPECVVSAIREYVESGVYGYYKIPDAYYQAFIDWEREHHGYEVKKEWIRQRASDLNRILPYYGVGKIGESYLFDYSRKLAYVGIRIYEHNLSQWENLAGSNYCLGYWEISNNGNSI